MQRYRIAFFVTLSTTILLAGMLALVWLAPQWLQTQAARMAAAIGPRGTAPPANPPESPAQGSAEPSLAPVTLTPQRMQSIGVTTGVAEYKPVHDEIRATGTVEADEARLSEVQVRFSGWIQKVYADSTFQQVRQGQPLLSIYSPDLVSTENEYVLAKQNHGLLARSTVPGVASGADTLLASAEERLKLWGIPEREVQELEQTGKVKRELEIDSPAAGFITERIALPNMYVQPGAKLYTIADLSTVWVYAQVAQDDLGRVRTGSPAEITVDSYPGRTFSGRVSFISPQLDQTTRTAKVRLEIANPGLKLSLGMFVDVRVDLPLGRQLVIPRSAIFQTGTRQVAFVDKGDGHFEPRDIETGAQSGDEVVVTRGLKAGDRIVTSANFLIDSESQLQAAMGAFAPPPEAPVTGGAAASQVSLDYASLPAVPRLGSNNLRVKLTGPAGAPVAGAQVTVTFFMPAMPAMGMAAMRNVATLADKGGGTYEGSADIQMGGTWQVTVLATKDGQTIAQKQISVTAEGGAR